MMKNIKAGWFWLAFFLTLSPLWNPTNPAIFVFLNTINFTLLIIAIIKTIKVIRARKDKEIVKLASEIFDDKQPSIKAKISLFNRIHSQSLLILIVAGILLLCAGFYWYELRPAKIRDECASKSRSLFGDQQRDYDFCIRKKGLAH